MKEIIRLDKYLADMNLGTRAQVKESIKKGKVQINGQVQKKPEIKVNIYQDEIMVDGKQVKYISYEYYMLHKPKGVVSATQDKRDKTVIDLIFGKNRKDLFPVGRLDKDTEGLLLITNDGELAHQLLSPKKHVEKTYFAKIQGAVTEEDIKKFKEGIDIGEEKPTLPAKLSVLKMGAISDIEVTIVEGKFHQVKRMFAAIGKPVLYLKRLSMGSLVLDESLKKGEYRPLTEQEKKKLFEGGKRE
ncbi:MAG: pseudouridine synthase [Lachnospiraceae bacterium]